MSAMLEDTTLDCHQLLQNAQPAATHQQRLPKIDRPELTQDSTNED